MFEIVWWPDGQEGCCGVLCCLLCFCSTEVLKCTTSWISPVSSTTMVPLVRHLYLTGLPSLEGYTTILNTGDSFSKMDELITLPKLPYTQEIANILTVVLSICPLQVLSLTSRPLLFWSLVSSMFSCQISRPCDWIARPNVFHLSLGLLLPHVYRLCFPPLLCQINLFYMGLSAFSSEGSPIVWLRFFIYPPSLTMILYLLPDSLPSCFMDLD